MAALTDAPILSDEIDRDDAGTIIEVGRVFWFPDYQVLEEIEELRNRGVLLFRGVFGIESEDEPKAAGTRITLSVSLFQSCSRPVPRVFPEGTALFVVSCSCMCFPPSDLGAGV